MSGYAEQIAKASWFKNKGKFGLIFELVLFSIVTAIVANISAGWGVLAALFLVGAFFLVSSILEEQDEKDKIWWTVFFELSGDIIGLQLIMFAGKCCFPPCSSLVNHP